MKMVFACGDCGETHNTPEEAVNCHSEESSNEYKVTSCCGAELGKKTVTDYPLGGTTWGIDYGGPCCSECGEEEEL